MREALGNCPEPVAAGHHVVVGEGDDLASRNLYPAIAGRRRSRMRLAHHPRSGNIHRRNLPGAVIDDDHFVVRVVNLGHGRHAASQRIQTREIAGYDDAYPRQRKLGIAVYRAPRPAEMTLQFVLEFRGGNQRASRGYFNTSQRISGVAHENPGARIGRLFLTRAVQIAQRLRDIDYGDSYRAAQLHRNSAASVSAQHASLAAGSVPAHRRAPIIRLVSDMPRPATVAMPSYSRAATDPLVCTTTLTAFLKVDAPTAVAVYRYTDLVSHKGISAERR